MLVETSRSRPRAVVALDAGWRRWRQWASRHTLVLDAVLAVMLVGPILLAEIVAALPWDSSVASTTILVSTAIAMAALAFRRVRADASGLTIAACGYLTVAVVTHIPVPGVMLAAAVGSYSMAAYGSSRGSWVALPLTVFGAVIFAIRHYSTVPDGVEVDIVWYLASGVLMMAVAAAGFWGLGMWRRFRSREVEGLRERARLLEAERAQEAELAAAGERTRIAREMHDIIAHSLTVVIAQADGGRYAAADDPSAAPQALENISRTGRNALADMRSLLGVLREDDHVRDTSVLPTIADVDELVETMRSGGLHVSFRTSGTPADIGIGGELTVYRVVQESLTNVVKHAGPTSSVEVHLDWHERGLTITVTNDARGPQDPIADPTTGTGKGILGMRERLALHGGTLRTGKWAGGFEVVADLPTQPAAAGESRGRL